MMHLCLLHRLQILQGAVGWLQPGFGHHVRLRHLCGHALLRRAVQGELMAQ